VAYEGREPATDLDLPHRAFDGHVRSGRIDGNPATDDPRYRAARDATPANAKALLETSPISLVLGSWDSTRGSNQARYRSLITGETIGVLADQGVDGRDVPRRGAARTDSIAASVRLSGADMEKVLTDQESELSVANVERIRSAIKKAGTKGTVSGSTLGLGSIPPSMDGIGFVSCRSIVRHHVLSFAALRQLRFGLGAEDDVHARVLLAALGLNGLARSDAELLIRANCDLIEAGPTEVVLDGRFGQTERYDALSIEEADALLETAIDAAVATGVRWEGQTLDIVGNPLIAGGLSADDDGE
jgi:CRISPR-associated protein Csb1